MSKRIYLGSAAAAVAGVFVWLAARPVEPDSADARSPASAAAPITPIPAANTLAPDVSAEPTRSGRPQVAAAPVDSVRMESKPAFAEVEQPMPIDVSPGFEFLNKSASEMKDTDGRWPNWRHHQKLQSEPRDDTWAPRIEAALRAAFQRAITSDGIERKQVEVLVIECRTTGCEIQAGGYLTSDGILGGDFNSVYFKVLNGPLGAEFDLDASTVTIEARPEGRAGILAFLPRKPS